MKISIELGKKILNAGVEIAENPKACILFLSGGSIEVGKERYFKWQENLKNIGVSSVSFDYSGVNASGTSLKESSLESRIEEGVAVTEWIKQNMPAPQYMLYGASMGGYIALGLIDRQQGVFKNILLQDASHDIWGDTQKDARFRNTIFQALKNFLECYN